MKVQTRGYLLKRRRRKRNNLGRKVHPGRVFSSKLSSVATSFRRYFGQYVKPVLGEASSHVTRANNFMSTEILCEIRYNWNLHEAGKGN